MHLAGNGSCSLETTSCLPEGGLKLAERYAAATTRFVPNSFVVFYHLRNPVGFVYYWILRIGSGAQTRFGGGLQLRASHLRAEG